MLESIYNAYEDFTPNPGAQEKFMLSNAWNTAYLAGYGSGKTSVGAHKSLDLACINEGLDGMIVAPTWGLLHRVTLRTFYDETAEWGEDVLPHQWVRLHNKGKRYIELKNRARIYYGSADRPKTLEGSNVAWFWIDEGRYISRTAWQTMLGRLRHAKAKLLQGIVTSTPAPGWLQEVFGGEREATDVFHGSTYENRAHLAPGFIERLERQYGRRVSKSLIHGRFGAAEYGVYGDFDFENRHGIEWKYKPGFRTVGVVDFGRRRPAVLFAQQPHHGAKLGPNKWALPGTWILFDQIVQDDLTTAQLGDLITQRIADRGYHVQEWYCDPAGTSRQSSSGISDVHALRAAGARASAREENHHGLDNISWTRDEQLTFIPNGVALVEGMLANTRNETLLYVAKSLADGGPRGVVAALEGYHYPEPRDGRQTSDHPVKDGVTDHIADTIRYLAINEAVREGGDEIAVIDTR